MSTQELDAVMEDWSGLQEVNGGVPEDRERNCCGLTSHSARRVQEDWGVDMATMAFGLPSYW